MKTMKLALIPLALAALAGSVGAQQQQPAQPQANQPPPQPMSFFVTSVGKGDGANLGGLAGADAHCQSLAAAAGRGGVTWRAYMSAGAQGANGVTHARDRIGRGPWFNARGALIASNVDDLHQDRNNIRKPTALNEKGEEVNGVGDKPNQHDILTGSTADGRAYTDSADHTCNNWTSNNAGSAQLGHSDKQGGGNSSWNSTHASKGCSQDALIGTGGAGLLYCFAVK